MTESLPHAAPQPTHPPARPLQIAMTATVVVESLLFMPSLPDEGATKLHDSLQQFAWTERGVAPLVRRRGFPAEPCFCFETALKAAYAALHVYRHFRPDSTETSISTALALFGATHYEWLREPRHDSNCLLMWGPRCLVIAFRGTSSAANIKADLKVCVGGAAACRGPAWLSGTSAGHGLEQRLTGWLAGFSVPSTIHAPCVPSACQPCAPAGLAHPAPAQARLLLAWRDAAVPPGLCAELAAGRVQRQGERKAGVAAARAVWEAARLDLLLAGLGAS